MYEKMRFKKLLQNELIRDSGLFAIAFVSFFMCLPMKFSMMLSKYRTDPSYYTGGTKTGLLNSFVYENMEIYVTIAILAVINAIVVYTYLHSKEKLDFYFSQPVKRNHLFWIGYLKGVIYLFFSYLINLLLVVILGAGGHGLSSAFLHMIVSSFLVNMIFFLAVYSTAILASVMSGKIFFVILQTLLLLFYFPMFDLAFSSYRFSRGRALFDHIQTIRYFLSPITVVGMYYEKLEDISVLENKLHTEILHYGWKYILTLFIIALIFTFVSNRLYLKRKSETAGQSIVFPIAKHFMKIAVCLLLLCILSFGIVGEYFNGTIWYNAIGFMISLPIVLFGVVSLYEQQWKRPLKGWKRKIAFLLICVLCLATTGLYKYVSVYHGFRDATPHATASELVEDGCVVWSVRKPLQGEENWEKFVKDTKSGKDSKIRIAYDCQDYYSFSDIYFKHNKYYFYTQGDLTLKLKFPYLVEEESTTDDGRHFTIMRLSKTKDPEKMRSQNGDDNVFMNLFYVEKQ